MLQVYNITAMSDLKLLPSLKRNYYSVINMLLLKRNTLLEILEAINLETVIRDIQRREDIFLMSLKMNKIIPFTIMKSMEELEIITGFCFKKRVMRKLKIGRT